MRAFLGLIVVAGCTSSSGTGDDVVVPDANVPTCDPTAAFGTPTLVGGLDSGADEHGARFTTDERTVYFNKATGAEDHDLYSATRADASGSFGTATALALLNTGTSDELAPTVTADGLLMVYVSNRGNTYDLFLADRPDLTEELMTVSQIVGTNTGFDETGPYLTPDGSELYFASDRDGDADLYRATPSGSSFGGTAMIAELSSAGEETFPVLSDDGRTIFFSRDGNIFSASRASSSGAFSGIAAVAELGAGSPLWVSPGGCRLFFAHDGGGTDDVYVAERPE